MSEKKKPTAKKTEEKLEDVTSSQNEASPQSGTDTTAEETTTEEVVTSESATPSEEASDSASVEEKTVQTEKSVSSESSEESTSEEKPADEVEAPAESQPVTAKKSSQEEDADFDWESFEKGDEEYTSSQREALEKDYLSTLNTIESDQVIDGRVVSISDREVIVNINYKSDGIISRNEFRYKEDFKVGDTVEVLVEKKEDKKGQLILSHKKARVFRSWEKVNEAFDKDIVVEGSIKCRTKGGMIVEVLGLEAFFTRLPN